jgi:hypothetical protein
MKSFYLGITILLFSSLSIGKENPQEKHGEFYSDTVNSASPYLNDKSFDGSRKILPGEDHAWDEIQHRSVTMWQCRNTKTLITVSKKLCDGKEMVDNTWPDKKPRNYEGRKID